MSAPGSSPRPARAVTIFTVALLVAGPPLEYLRHSRYPMLTPEVLVPTAFWLVCAVAFGTLLNRASRPVRIVAFTLLAMLFVDGQFSANLDPSLKLYPFAILLVVWLLERHIETIAAVFLAVFYLASLPTITDIKPSVVNFSGVQRDTTLPPVLYMILDQHIGTEGWPPEFAITRGMQRRTRQFYLDEGFHLFGRAYTEFTQTRFSIPAALNWTGNWTVANPRSLVTEISRGLQYRLADNELFRQLSAKGYRIRVYQSTYLDFCDPHAYAIQSCRSHTANTIRGVAFSGASPWTKAMLMLSYFLERRSHVYAVERAIYSHLAERYGWPVWEDHNGWFTFPQAVALLDELRDDLRADDSRGTAYFAHVLAPHEGFVVDSTCRAWGYTRMEFGRSNDGDERTPARRARKYELYTAQVGCLYHHLDTLFHLIDSTPALRRMVVIVHGDHGSRIALHNVVMRNLTTALPSDLEDGLSTLFAIRGPGIPAGYDRLYAPLTDLVGAAVTSGFTRVDAREPPVHVARFSPGPGMPFGVLRLADTTLARPDRPEPAPTPIAPAAAPAAQQRRP